MTYEMELEHKFGLSTEQFMKETGGTMCLMDMESLPKLTVTSTKEIGTKVELMAWASSFR